MTPILTCEHLTKTYGVFRALDDVSFTIEPGKIVGLLGENGAGKSTLLKILAGMLTKTSGSAQIDGNEPGVLTKSYVSYLPDKSYLQEWMKLSDLFALFSRFFADFDLQKAQGMAKDLGLSEKARLKAMSKGMQEKVHLILTMSRHAKLYLLDEPIGGVDPAARDYILDTILTNFSEDASILISTHMIADVEQILDEAIFLKQGKLILHAPVDELRETHHQSVDALFREVYRS